MRRRVVLREPNAASTRFTWAVPEPTELHRMRRVQVSISRPSGETVGEVLLRSGDAGEAMATSFKIN